MTEGFTSEHTLWFRNEGGECRCTRCLTERDAQAPWGGPVVGSMMIVCGTCGNKRCPHANDHRFACTHSNEPGQPGSAYA